MTSRLDKYRKRILPELIPIGEGLVIRQGQVPEIDWQDPAMSLLGGSIQESLDKVRFTTQEDIDGWTTKLELDSTAVFTNNIHNPLRLAYIKIGKNSVVNELCLHNGIPAESVRLIVGDNVMLSNVSITSAGVYEIGDGCRIYNCSLGAFDSFHNYCRSQAATQKVASNVTAVDSALMGGLITGLDTAVGLVAYGMAKVTEVAPYAIFYSDGYNRSFSNVEWSNHIHMGEGSMLMVEPTNPYDQTRGVHIRLGKNATFVIKNIYGNRGTYDIADNARVLMSSSGYTAMPIELNTVRLKSAKVGYGSCLGVCRNERRGYYGAYHSPAESETALAISGGGANVQLRG